MSSIFALEPIYGDVSNAYFLDMYMNMPAHMSVTYIIFPMNQGYICHNTKTYSLFQTRVKFSVCRQVNLNKKALVTSDFLPQRHCSCNLKLELFKVILVNCWHNSLDCSC